MSYTTEMNITFWRAIFSGSFSNEDLRNLATTIRTLNKERPLASTNGLVDLRALAEIDVDFNTVSAVTSDLQDVTLANEIKIAIVTDAPIQYGFARMFQTLLNHRLIDMQLFFADEQDALTWISK